jgi:hypothetical protein
MRGTQQGRWLNHHAIRQKVWGSIPDIIRFTNLPNPSSRAMVLELIKPLTEMNTFVHKVSRLSLLKKQLSSDLPNIYLSRDIKSVSQL